MNIKSTFQSILLGAVLITAPFAFTPISSAKIAPSAPTVDFYEQEVTLQKQGNSLLSEVIVDRKAFNSVAVKLDKNVDNLIVNFGDGWEPVEIHDDGDGFDRLLVTAPTHSMQFRLDKPESDEPLKLKTTVFYDDEKLASAVSAELQASTTITSKSYKIISRSEWGADEGLRVWSPKETTVSSGTENEKPTVDPCASIAKDYADQFKITAVKEYNEDGEPLTWPISYASKIEKFAIHHTDSEIRDINGDLLTDTRDYQAIVRAIYYFHTISRGWGDIGYTYLIDPLGNIYEGRNGGDKAIGAHTLCFNHGVIGIAIIGNYQANEVPEPAMQALIWLLGKKGKEYGIDPQGVTDFRGKDNLSNVFGHKDVRATSCPGDKLYADLPKIRDRAELAMRSFSETTLSAADYDYNAELTAQPDLLLVGPGEQKTITLKYKNTGKKAWDDTTWLHVALNNDPNARVVSVVQDKNFVAADLQEASVAPGKIGTFIVEIEGGFKPGHYAFQVSPVINGRYKISRAAQYLSFQIQDPAYSYEIVTHQFPSGTVFQGQKLQATLELKNTGNVTWRNYGNNSISLGTADPKDRLSIFVKNNPSRIGYLTDNEVAPGGTGHFVMNLVMPEDKQGEVIERFIPVIENAGWLDDKALGFKVTIKKPVHFARTVKVDTLATLFPGERKFVEVDMKNMGDLPWDSSTVETTLLGRGIKVFKRLLVPQEPVKPGETMKIGFWVEAPAQAGTYSINLRTSFNGKPIRGAMAEYVVRVPSPVLHGAKMDQGATILNIAPREEKLLTVTFKNTGNMVWKKMGANAVHLGTSNPSDRQSKLFVKSDWLDPFRAADLEEDEVMPGDIGTFKFKIRSDVNGRVTEDFQLVMEGVGWIPGANVRWQVNVSGNAAATTTPTKMPTTKPATTKPSTPTTAPVSPVTTPVTTVPKTTEQPFRVRLTYDASTATLTADKDFFVMNEKDQVILNLAAGKQIVVKRVANAFQVTAGTQTKNATIVRLVPKTADGVVTIVSMERRPTWNKDLNDNQFRGVVEMRVVSDQLAYINELPLEDYLKGLAEVSNGDPTEKLKTIAVLARTYARFYMSDDNRKFPDMPYDGSDDPAIFQRYLGYGVETRSPNFVTAATDTKDMVVTYQGKMVKTPYFNQSDGRTRSAQEVWGWTTTPYLVSVSDPACKGLELKGHGVGLSGFGATAMANEGKKFDEIIKYYYTGVAIQSVTSNL